MMVVLYMYDFTASMHHLALEGPDAGYTGQFGVRESAKVDYFLKVKIKMKKLILILAKRRDNVI